jgi:(1->4)-alpha-D-glucan 1-alpha-D-glucosylmutase
VSPRVPAERIVPRATYRLQLHPGYTFDDAAALVPYLRDLGVSHLYLSPCLEAVPGSTHGYDVVDPTRIRAELGGADGLDRLASVARDDGLGIVLDIVPNHVGLVSPGNPWWWDVLRSGPDGRYGRHLDVVWQPGVHGQPSLLLPQLGADLDEELAAGTLTLDHLEGAPFDGWRVRYHEHAWPVRPGSLAAVGLDEDDVEAALTAVASDPGLLRALLDHQHYRLAHWRRANDELDHRRFFDVWTLGAVRIEDPAVFADAHAAILPRIADGTLDGLRIDHPDGLRDPAGYFERLRAEVGGRPWIVIEKILEGGERLRLDWPVDGTVGYRFADVALGLHVDGDAGPILDDLQASLTGERIDREQLIDLAKRAALTSLFGAEIRRLAGQLTAALTDVGEHAAVTLLIELVAAWPVYRTYVRPDRGIVGIEDREIVDRAVARVRARDVVAPELLEQVRDLLLLVERSPAADEVVWAFQQLTGPAIAKGIEDTVLYRDLRFVAVNEVGGDPGHLGRGVGDLHALNAATQNHKPASMLLSSTHDTKRSEDVRARLAVLSQDPDHWVRTVQELSALAAGHRGPHGPTRAHEHLVYQTLVGTWPIDADRLTSYLRKAAREGKDATDWLDPDRAYERDLDLFARALLDDEAVVAALETVVGAVREPGWLTSLSLVLLKLTSPGVPDTYQGCELWDLSLVDPDNRRPVDHDLRRRLLDELMADTLSPEALLARLDEGLPKLELVRRALAVRAERPEAFGPAASYLPLWAHGARAGLVAAYVRGGEVVSVAPLQVRRLGPDFASWAWGDTGLELPDGRWRDRVTGELHAGVVPLERLTARFPVALLTRER